MRDVRLQMGLPDSAIRAAAELYDEAFGQKLRAAIRNDGTRIDVLEVALDPSKAVGAFNDAALVGLAGFHDDEGSLTRRITFSLLRERLGWLKATRAMAVFVLLERKPQPGELLMDGIVVRSDSRGQGIGTALFAELEEYCRHRGFGRIRLDVVDTNPAAQRLYVRLGFQPVATSRAPWLRRFMGFGASTTMVKVLERI